MDSERVLEAVVRRGGLGSSDLERGSSFLADLRMGRNLKNLPLLSKICFYFIKYKDGRLFLNFD